MKTWHTFAFLIVAALVWYYLGRLAIVLVACFFLFKFWMWLAWRYPLVVMFIIGFFRGLR
jgi:hypothetical protein